MKISKRWKWLIVAIPVLLLVCEVAMDLASPIRGDWDIFHGCGVGSPNYEFIKCSSGRMVRYALWTHPYIESSDDGKTNRVLKAVGVEAPFECGTYVQKSWNRYELNFIYEGVAPYTLYADVGWKVMFAGTNGASRADTRMFFRHLPSLRYTWIVFRSMFKTSAQPEPDGDGKPAP